MSNIFTMNRYILKSAFLGVGLGCDPLVVKRWFSACMISSPWTSSTSHCCGNYLWTCVCENVKTWKWNFPIHFRTDHTETNSLVMPVPHLSTSHQLVRVRHTEVYQCWNGSKSSNKPLTGFTPLILHLTKADHTHTSDLSRVGGNAISTKQLH